MLTSALGQIFGSTGRAPGSVAQLILLLFIIGLACFLTVQIMRRRFRRRPDLILAASGGTDFHESNAKGVAAPEADHANALSKGEGAAMDISVEVESLMSAVRDQAVELRGEHAKIASSLSLNFDVLANRLSTVQPLLAKAMKLANESKTSVGLLTVSNDDYKRKLAEAERDIALYRPLALKMEEDLRLERLDHAETKRKFDALEEEHARAQGAHNELFQKMSSAELDHQRAAEEKDALVQKLNEHDSAIQSLLRENAHLKSEIVSVTADLERAEHQSRSLAEKYATDLENGDRAKTSLNSLQAEFDQFRKESSAQIKQVKERESALTEALSIKEKQFYESEIKRSAIDSKVDFLTRTNQRLREDVRQHLDHVGNLEASNRKLLDALARNSAAEQDTAAKDPATAPRVPPKLRTVSEPKE